LGYEFKDAILHFIQKQNAVYMVLYGTKYTVVGLQKTFSAKEAPMRTYLVKILLKGSGSVSWVEVQAKDGAHAKALVRAQYGDSVDILEAKPK